jgi:hypothetical protein
LAFADIVLESRLKRLKSIGIKPAETFKIGRSTSQNILQPGRVMALCYCKYKNKWLQRRFCFDSAPQVWHSYSQRDWLWESRSFKPTQVTRRTRIGSRNSGKVWDASSFSGRCYDGRCSGRDVRRCFYFAEHGDIALLREHHEHSGDDHAGCQGHRDTARSAPCEPASGYGSRPRCRIEDLRRRPRAGRTPTKKAVAMRLFLCPQLAWSCEDAES